MNLLRVKDAGMKLVYLVVMSEELSQGLGHEMVGS